jgi:hypothetical protein
MNKFKFYFIVLITTLSLFSCSKNDTPAEITPARDYKVQFDTDNTTIESYLNSNYITVINHPGFTDDQDVTIAKIDAGQPSIMSYLDNAIYPKLLTRKVNLHGIEYKIYYLVLREGEKDIVTSLGGESPTNTDAVWASYNGTYLQSTTVDNFTSVTATQFEESKFPKQYFSLLGTIKGWGEIFPQFKTGSYEDHKVNGIPDGTTDYTKFGAGVMFIPSGLAYFQNGPGSIPSYAPLVFSFKLYEIQRSDSDGDGILNYQEDLNGDGYMYDYRNLVNYPTTPSTNPDDTDGDGIPNFVDIDDDGDNYTTKLESKRPELIVNNLAVSNGYYPFIGASVDNPTTPNIDEKQGIPSCSSDFITPTRLRKHLDKSCH